MAAVAVGVLVQVLLVVALGVVERAEWGDLGGDVAVAERFDDWGVEVAGALGLCGLFRPRPAYANSYLSTVCERGLAFQAAPATALVATEERRLG